MQFETFFADAANGNITVADITVNETEYGAIFTVEIWFDYEERILRSYVEIPEEAIDQFTFDEKLPLQKLRDHLSTK